jgi:GNAT superfamily N-acetyltransferase
MLIRGAQPEDALAVAKVHVRSWQSAYVSHLPDDYLARLDPIAAAERYSFGIDRADTPHTLLAVGDEGGQIIGFASTGPSNGAEPGRQLGEVYGLYVDPDRWRTGCGRQLMAAARARLAELGFTEAVLWVLDGNGRAEAFYRADGWTRDGAERDEVLGPDWWSSAATTRADTMVWPRIHEVRYRRRL